MLHFNSKKSLVIMMLSWILFILHMKLRFYESMESGLLPLGAYILSNIFAIIAIGLSVYNMIKSYNPFLNFFLVFLSVPIPMFTIVVFYIGFTGGV